MQGGDWKAMFKGIQDGDYELVRFYLKSGIDPNYQHPEYLAAPLVESVRFGQNKITRLLLESGADPNIKEVMGGETALLIARNLKNEEAIELLSLYNDGLDLD